MCPHYRYVAANLETALNAQDRPLNVKEHMRTCLSYGVRDKAQQGAVCYVICML